MKKILAFLLAVAMFIIPVTVFAEESSVPFMGDVNSDGKISAADARLILRYSAKLSPEGDFDLLHADADGSAVVNAADARKILRVSAKLDKLECGFDAEGKPNAVKMIEERKFVMKATIKDGKEKTNLTIAINGNDTCVIYDGQLPGDNSEQTMSGFGILIIDEQIYATCDIGGEAFAFVLTEDILDLLVDDDFSITDIENIIYMAIPEEFGTPEKTEVDNLVTYTYKYKNNGEEFILKTDAYGVPKTITSGNSSSPISFDITSIKSSNVDYYFNLDNYVLL